MNISFDLLSGTDTVKRGVSPIGMSASMSNVKLKESESNYSVRNSNLSEHNSSTLDRTKTSNGTRSVLFAADLKSSSRSPSSQSIVDQLKSSQSNHYTNTSMSNSTSTSQLIKQTLSPLSQYRNTSQHSSSDSNDANGKQNNGRTSYQFQLSGGTNRSKIRANHNDEITTVRSDKLSSPSRSKLSDSLTSTLASSVARNLSYQPESNYSMKSQSNSVTSSSSVGTAYTKNNSIYATLPKTMPNSFAGIDGIDGILNSIAYAANPENGGALNHHTNGTVFGSVSAVKNEFEQIIARNANNQSNFNHATSSVTAHNSIGAGNYNTIGSYRVQYASTNPFLQSFEPHSNDTNNDDK